MSRIEGVHSTVSSVDIMVGDICTQGHVIIKEKFRGKTVKGQQDINRRQTGGYYENQAAGYLRNKGYRILESNYRCPFGEIDLIAEDPAGMTVYLEVKYREDHRCGHPLEAVDVRKQKRICKSAVYHRMQRGISESCPCRFDVIGIDGNRELIHIENAFMMMAVDW